MSEHFHHHHQRNAIKFLLLFLLCMECNIEIVLAGGEGEVRCKEREREALLRFKKDFSDAHGLLSSWGSEDDKKECCEWRGVQCSNTTGHVTGLLLDYYDESLHGEISPALLELPYLINLDLSGKNFGGNRIPDFIGSMKQLESLQLFRCELSGSIPPQLGNLPSLRNLDLSYNMLDGLFETKGMVLLESLDLSMNQITGSVPPELGASSALTTLNLKSNNFTGLLPVSLAQLSKLQVLDISFNSLDGPISESNFVNLHSLKVLDLSFNSFTMHISPDWNPPFQLNLINLASCKMGPRFPQWIRTQTNFSWLDLSGAGLSEELPKWFWSSFLSLEYLNISSNQISGTIPDSSSTFIRTIDISSNNFSGSLPLLHPRAQLLQLSHNMFSGSISSICNSNLLLLDLSHNQFAVELPDCWDNMQGLTFLNLANNNFFGEIPHTLGSLGRLMTLYLRDNNLSGELPSSLRKCRDLRTFDVGGNKLTGNIPTWIGASYTNLAYLSLRRNRLDGSIPSEICNLTRMQILDLSENNLSGKIPKCFDNFTAMVDKNTTTITEIGVNIDATFYMRIPGVDIVKEYFADALVHWKGQEAQYREILLLLKLIDLSSNKLVGSIPRSFSKMKGLISLNLSRNSLTANIIQDIGQMEMLESLDLSTNQLSGQIPASMAQLNLLAVLDLANNNLTGEIPLSTQLQSFNASAYAGNNGLCGRPLLLCHNTSIDSRRENVEGEDSDFMSLFSPHEFWISLAFGSIVGFWGVVGSLVLKRSWRNTYFDFLDVVGDWLYITATIFLNKFRRG